MEKRHCAKCCTAVLAVGACVYNPVTLGVTIPITLAPVAGCKYNRVEVSLVPADENTKKALAVFNESFRPVSDSAWDLEFPNVPVGLWQPKARVFTDCGACEWVLGNVVPVEEYDMIKTGTFSIAPDYIGPVVVAGVGFQPDVVLIKSGAIGGAGMSSGFSNGVIDGVNQRACHSAMGPPPGLVPHAGGTINFCIDFNDGAGGSLAATQVSLDPDGFTLNVTSNGGLAMIDDFEYIAMKTG